jgi:hypothetical protein
MGVACWRSHLCISEGQLRIQWVAVVGNMSHELSELLPGVGAKRPHVPGQIWLTSFTLKSLLLPTQILIDKSLNIVLVLRPQTFRFVPDRIESPALDHQIRRAPDDEVRI